MKNTGGQNGDRAVRVEDVAREAGVSPITVSRALRTPDKVKAETLERVLEAVRKTGYQINTIASSLRSGQSSFVSVFVASLKNLHYADAMQGIIDAFEGSRFHLMFAQVGYSEDPTGEHFRALLPFKPAAIAFSGILRNAEAREFLKSLHVPILEMWGETESPVDMLVTSPAREGGRLMAEHLVEQGYRRIAYVGHTIRRAVPRIEGFKEGLALHGIDLALMLPAEGTTGIADGMAALDEVLRQLPDCDAMMFGTDVMAAGAIARAVDRGIAVPEQMGIAGYGDLFFAPHTRPALSSIRMSPYEIGSIGGKMLLSRLNGVRVPDPIIQVPLMLEARASTTRRKS